MHRRRSRAARERESGKEQERGGVASSTAGLPGGKGERGAGWMDGRRAVSRRGRRHAEVLGWSRRGRAGRKKLRNGDGGDVLRQKSGRPAAPGGQARAEGAGAHPLHRPNPPRPAGPEGTGSGREMEAGRPCGCQDGSFGPASWREAWSRVLLRHSHPPPVSGTQRPPSHRPARDSRHGTARRPVLPAGTGCAARRRGGKC